MKDFPGRVLHIDDDPVIRDLTHTVFKRATASVIVESCASGHDAVKKAPSFKPDLVLLDLNMPSPDGLATLDMLRQTQGTADTPVIFMSGRKDDFPATLPAGVIGFLQKPIPPAQMIETIKGLWNAHIVS